MKKETKWSELGKPSIFLLVHGLDDWVPLAWLSCVLFDQKLTGDEFVTEARAAIAPLLQQGLMEIGHYGVMEGGVPGFVPWDTSIDESLCKFEAIYRRDPSGSEWSFDIWLNLTPSGEELAKTLEGRCPGNLLKGGG